ncbi:alcohol dehydrogenase catalytic domain-containing protein (plasmid) [Rhizobium sophoriradicis]|uniref:alcohol dehydrogenase catalytic domain-containing protein n=1 Tax=Rhizobium sophoriradicis TaxID=1535245 RepID=UPI0017D3A973|nr:alcohol dehydrogenase catalytic domain-containing protein [Rhizobium leguminosarum bv. phaseoli]
MSKTIMPVMRAARIHGVGEPFRFDEVPTPRATGDDVLVEVKSCGLVPNLKNVIHHFPSWFPHLSLPPFPAIFGLDVAGVVAEIGPLVRGINVGQPVYINPLRSCGTCPACRAGKPMGCPSSTFAGYFGFGPDSPDVFRRYPWGGLAQYLVAPASSVVELPATMSFDQATRFGYMGTSYSGLLKGGAGPSSTLLVLGATGTLGVSAVLLAIALGVPKILAVARDEVSLARLKALSPNRIETFSIHSGSVADWARAATRGIGVDIVLECLATSAPSSLSKDAAASLNNGGRMVLVGGTREQISFDPVDLMVNQTQYIGSKWFTTQEGQQMAGMVAAGTLDLGCLGHQTFQLSEVNEALDYVVTHPDGGFTNVVVQP